VNVSIRSRKDNTSQFGRFRFRYDYIGAELQNIQTSRKLLSGKELVNKSKFL
jgi:hypothetical protein